MMLMVLVAGRARKPLDLWDAFRAARSGWTCTYGAGLRAEAPKRVRARVVGLVWAGVAPADWSRWMIDVDSKTQE